MKNVTVVGRSRNARGGAVLALLAVASLQNLACIVGPTNPWDDDAPPETQVKGRISGTAAFPSVSGEAPRPPEGIKVTARQMGGSAVLEAMTTAAAGGAFSFEVAPGDWTVRAEHPSFAAASAGPLRVTPGNVVQLDTLVLRLPDATSSLSGRVVAQGGLSAQGVEVSLLHNAGPVGCGAVEAKVTTGDDGSFLFSPIRPGGYVVVARTEGATLDLLAGAESLTIQSQEDAVLPRDLVIAPGTGVVVLESQGTSAASTTRTPDITVHLAALAGMTEMQLGGDPTFDPSLGGSGWRPFQATSGFTLPNAEGEWTVFAQLRAGCVTSPLYAARLLYDATPPELISAQVGTTLIPEDAPSPPIVVAGAAQAGLQVTLNVIDDSGVAAVHLLLEENGAVTPQIVPVEPQAGQSLVRVTATIPLEEGAYPLTVVVEDLAGNTTSAALSPKVIVLRDLSPPTTPLPVVSHMSVTGPRALLWLEDRACDDGSRQPLCEANPHPEGSFLVRGGPEHVDFTPFSSPPFDVALFDQGLTVFEIQSRDAGGALSPATARVEVTRAPGRDLFTAPVTKELGAPLKPRAIYNQYGSFTGFDAPTPPASEGAPPLFASGGTAFFSLRPRPGAGASSYYSYLIAQPTDVSDVGLNPSLSPMPGAVRKLSVGPLGGGAELYNDQAYDRVAAALGAGGGTLTWLESVPERFVYRPEPRRFVTYPSGNGRYDISTLRHSNASLAVYDSDGDRALNWFYEEALCETRGSARCQRSPDGWSPGRQAPPRETVTDGRQLITSSSGTRPLPLLGSDEGQITITGPEVIGVHLQRPVPGSNTPIAGIWLPVIAPAGEVLYSAYYYKSGANWRGLPTNDATKLIANPTTGSGEELIRAPAEFDVDSYEEIVGILVPDGVTVTVPLISVPPPQEVVAAGLVRRSLSSFADAGQLSVADPGGLDRTDVVLPVTLLVRDLDYAAGIGRNIGLTLSDWGPDLEPYTEREPNLADMTDPAAYAALAEESHAVLTAEGSATIEVPTSAATRLATPSDACTLLVRAEEDLVVRGFSVHGQGSLDDLWLSLWELEGETPFGAYEAATLNPTQSPEVARLIGWDPYDVYWCTDNEIPDTEETNSGTAPVTTVYDASEAVNAQPTVVGSASFDDAGPFSGTTPTQLVSLPVQAGQSLRAYVEPYLPSDTSDIILYLRFDQEPSRTVYDCRRDRAYSGGAEECLITVPQGATTAYLAAGFYSGSSGLRGLLEVVAGDYGVQPVIDLPVERGDLVHVEVDVTEGEVELQVNFDDPIGPNDYVNCSRSSAYYATPTCDLFVEDEPTQVYIAVEHVTLPAVYTVTTTITRGDLVQVASYDVEIGQAVRVTTSGTERVLPFVRFGGTPTLAQWDCTDDVDGYGTSADCTAYVPEGATTAYVAVAANGAATDYDVTAEVFTVGCTEARASSYQAEGVLRKGRYYVIAMSGYPYSGPLGWSDEYPAVEVGAPLQTAYLDVLGTVPDAEVNGGRLVVPGYDPLGERCRVNFEVAAAARFRSLALSEGQVSAVREVTLPNGTLQHSVVLASAASADPASGGGALVVRELAAGRRALATSVTSRHVYWVATDGNGRQAAVWRRPYLEAGPSGQACEVGRLPLDFSATAAAFDKLRLGVVGTAAGQDAAHVYQVDDAGACGGLTAVAKRKLAAPGRAVALDDEDLYAWIDRASTGGVLVHQDLRDLQSVFPGGPQAPFGFDAREGAVLFSRADLGDVSTGRLLELTTDVTTGRATGARTLASGTFPFHPRYLDGGVAWIAPSTATTGAVPVLRVLPDLSGAAPVGLSGADALLSGAPSFDEADPGAWARLPLIESDGSHLAVLGYADANYGRRLAIYDLPADPSSWSTLGPELEIDLGEGAPVAALFVSDGLVVVTFDSLDRPAQAFFHDVDSGLWLPAAVDAPDAARVIGAALGQIVLLEKPAGLFDARPPPFGSVWMRTPETSLSGPADVVGRVPAALYLHRFSMVDVGPTGELLLYDETARPKALWRVDKDTGAAVPSEGPSRPLNKGGEQLGLSSVPRASADGLYFLRRSENGVALMRYRSGG